MDRKIIIGSIKLIKFIRISILVYLYNLTALINNTSMLSQLNKHNDLFSLFSLIGLIGGCIALTLTYVSWKKYNAEKNKNNKDSNS